jgi:ribosome-binding factor A
MKGLRGERLSSQFQQEISDIIAKKLRNRCAELSAIISVTQADIAPDLKSAKIYVSIYDVNEDRKLASFQTIKDNAGFIRRELSKILHLRTVPELRFILDGTMEYGEKIDKLLFEISNELDKGDEE